MSGWLDQMGEAVALVAADLGIGECQATGRHGLPAEAALRCGLLKQYFQLSYQELAFHVSDSVSLRTFARLPLGWNPRKSVLQKTISAISPTTWERINRMLLRHAEDNKLETGKRIRIDSTVSETTIHEPSDNTLLWDAVRVMVRLLQWTGRVPLAPRLIWRNHTRSAKRRAHAIHYRRGKNRVAHYR